MQFDDGMSEAMLLAAANLEHKSPEQMINEVNFYNADFSAYGNEIYEKVSSRVAHLVNYRKGSWFNQRIDLFLDILALQPKTLLIDIGFSISYLKASQRFSNADDIGAVLVEKYESAERFHELFAQHFPERRDKFDRVVIGDIESQSGIERIVNAAAQAIDERPDGYERVLIVATELVEHLDDSSKFWLLCRNIEKALALPVELFVSLPICDSIPSHSMAFRTSANALTYLRGGMSVTKIWFLEPPNKDANSILKGCLCVLGTLPA